MDKTVPPNEKAWTEEEREMVKQQLPGYMSLGETNDMRVGMWVPLRIGSVAASDVAEEVDEIKDSLGEIGLDIKDNVILRTHHSPVGRGDSLAYKVEIGNWKSKDEL